MEVCESTSSLNREIFASKNEKNTFDNPNEDYQKENVYPCSKKMKLFEDFERRYLLACNENSLVVTNDQEPIKCTTSSDSVWNAMEISHVDTPVISTLKEVDNSFHRDEKENEVEQDTEEESSAEEDQDDDSDFVSSKSDDDYCCDVDDDIEKENEDDDENEESESKDPPKDLVDNLLEVLKKVLAVEKENKLKEKIAKENEIKLQAEILQASISQKHEEQINEDGEIMHDRKDYEAEKSSDDEEKNLSIFELTERNRLKQLKQISSLLQSAKAEIFQTTEEPKRLQNPRKRKRLDSIDEASRALIKEVTPVRRSSRQIERKYYSEGVEDPELVAILQKLENYSRLNVVFKPSADEACYAEDFRGFNLDEAKRNLYLDPNPRRRYRRVQHRTSMRAVPVPTLDVSEVTDSVLSKVVTQVSLKVYSQAGSTCHQCRQKTTDTKTFCRSGQCTGVRGQFCGVCLLNRYGEDIVKALLDEKWSCPPCRDICNCSICRNRRGLPPTGILTPLALHKGYESVKDYLQDAEKDLKFIEY